MVIYMSSVYMYELFFLGGEVCYMHRYLYFNASVHSQASFDFGINRIEYLQC